MAKNFQSPDEGKNFSKSSNKAFTPRRDRMLAVVLGACLPAPGRTTGRQKGAVTLGEIKRYPLAAAIFAVLNKAFTPRRETLLKQ